MEELKHEPNVSNAIDRMVDPFLYMRITGCRRRGKGLPRRGLIDLHTARTHPAIGHSWGLGAYKQATNHPLRDTVTSDFTQRNPKRGREDPSLPNYTWQLWEIKAIHLSTGRAENSRSWVLSRGMMQPWDRGRNAEARVCRWMGGESLPGAET